MEFLEWAAKYDHKVDYGFFDQIKIEDLNNGLKPVDNLRLFKSVDIIEIVSLVLKGLKNI